MSDVKAAVEHERAQWIKAVENAVTKMEGSKNTVEIAKAAMRWVIIERRALLAEENRSEP